MRSKLKNVKEGDLIYLLWIDSCNPVDAGWHNDSFLEDFYKNALLIEDVGWVIKYCHECIVLIGGRSVAEEGYNTQYHREIMIPLSAVRMVKILKKA